MACFRFVYWIHNLPDSEFDHTDFVIDVDYRNYSAQLFVLVALAVWRGNLFGGLSCDGFVKSCGAVRRAN